jgi:hypothetical protein
MRPGDEKRVYGLDNWERDGAGSSMVQIRKALGDRELRTERLGTIKYRTGHQLFSSLGFVG